MHRLGSLVILFAFASVAAFAGAPAGGADAATAAPAAAAALDGKAALERLKALAGTWEGTTAGPEPHPAKSIFSVTAGGTAVVEKMFPGTPHEMVTVYFLEGAALRVTHYCSAGNQPHMRFDARASTADVLHFAFDGGTGFDPKKDLHVHSARFVFSADGALTEEWEFHNEGGKNGTHAMTLTRAAS
jgi:hypothetical protein